VPVVREKGGHGVKEGKAVGWVVREGGGGR